MKRMFVQLAVLGLLWSGPAVAQSAKSVLEETGFVGRWASQCESGPKLDNAHQFFDIRSSGSAQVRLVFGKGYEDLVYVIREIKRLPGDQIWMRTRFKSEERELIMRRNGNRLRTMSNRKADGTFVVKDGIIVAGDNETAWLTRCR